MEKRTNIYKKAVITAVAIFATFIGFIPVCIILADYVGDMDYLIIYAALYLGLGLYCLTLNCPKCGYNLFKNKYGVYVPITHEECPNCKLNLNKYYSKEDFNLKL